jgi:hypothetical protein
LDFHGWYLLRGAHPNRILNRYDRKRECDRGQSAFCVPINHFSPPYLNEPIATLLEQALSPSSISRTIWVNDQSSCVREYRGHGYIQIDLPP